MGVIHHFAGQNGSWDWEGVAVEDYTHKLPGVTTRRFISRQDGSHNLELRYFELAPSASSNLEQHVHEHAVLILRGQGQVLLGDEWHPIKCGDAIFIPTNETHQFRAAEDDTLGFLCAVLSRRLRAVAHDLAQVATPG